MDHQSVITPWDLECMLCDETAEPKALPLSLLKKITHDFSDKQAIGRGGFAVVYKGMLENRTVAVKRMSNTYMYEKEFQREVECLMIAKHKNVVRFLGYCADTQGNMARYEGKFVMADVQQRLLCFEYLPKGSLHEYITDMSCGLQWRDRYQIITGICQGLHYLHHKHIVHLDLKPANILLDDDWVPKITDFGISRCFHEMQSQVITKIAGTPGYLAPESYNHTKVTYRHSYRLDIYSLGIVIIEILTGNKGYHDVDKVVESWSNMLEQSQSEVQKKQIRVCAQIGIECTNFDPAKRPDTLHIISRLDETESMGGYIKTGMITSQQVGDVLNKLHQDAPNTPRESSSEENATVVTVAGTNKYDSFWRNMANLDMFNETIHSLDPDIKRCFEYCSIFPRGSKLRMVELVHLWIAQGFVKISCATEDMEEVAEGYFQELVSRSFLQPEESSYDTGCFTIHDALLDLFDKVSGDCFRIENGHRGDGWEGDIRRDIQHLLIRYYDGKLITEKILGLENLLTLIVYKVDAAPVEERVIESICKRLPKLRVLAIPFILERYPGMEPNELSVPGSITQLKHLRYLAFRTNRACMLSIPRAPNKHHRVQVLDFGDGKLDEFNCVDLINLRHINSGSSQFPFRNISRLTSLQTIACAFRIRDAPGYEVKQLRDLNKLRGSLEINGLEIVKSKEEALESKLAAKERLSELKLQWRHSSPEVQAEVLEGLCPPVALQTLELHCYNGSRYPDWMVGKPDGGPKELQELLFWSCSQLEHAPEAFPHLRVLKLAYCNWDALPGNMEHLTSLKKLEIEWCSEIRSLPTLPQSLEEFSVEWCNDGFMKSCQIFGHPNWQKIEHIPRKTIEGLAPMQEVGIKIRSGINLLTSFWHRKKV